MHTLIEPCDIQYVNAIEKLVAVASGENPDRFSTHSLHSGENPDQFSTHSLQRGGVTKAFEAQVSTKAFEAHVKPEQIKLHGAWKSDFVA